MRKVFVIFLLFAITVWAAIAFFKKESALYSPIPKVFGISLEQPIINNWFPETSTNFADENLESLNLSAKSALLVDYDSGELVYAKNVAEKLPVASTVKIMTAIVALEKKSLNDIFSVSAKAAHIGEDSMNLGEGERVTLRELLYGLMLVSGNDAAITISEGVSGNEDAFVNLMNQKVKSLGLSSTHFVNASGLDEDGKAQYSTAYDMTTIARYAWEHFSVFRQISSTEHIFFAANGIHKDFDLYSDTNLLTTYPGVRGIKPGFTFEAGLCLITYAENNGRRLLAVILGSDDRRGEMKELLDYGFAHYGITVSHPVLDL